MYPAGGARSSPRSSGRIAAIPFRPAAQWAGLLLETLFGTSELLTRHAPPLHAQHHGKGELAKSTYHHVVKRPLYSKVDTATTLVDF